MADRTFDPSGPLFGTLQAPADKSISHRSALLGAMSDGACTIEGYLDAADTRSSLDAVAALGAGVEITGEDATGLRVEIEGVGLRGPKSGTPVDVGNAGTLIRLISVSYTHLTLPTNREV